MKDLKYTIYFENLLEDAHNELIKKAQDDGKICLGYTCYHIPEVILNVDNCFSTRLRAPNTGSVDIATYYMSNYTCLYARAIVERAIEGGYNFLDAMIGVDACSMMNRSMEHFDMLNINADKEHFFVTHCDMPFKVTDYTIDEYVVQMQLHVLDRLHEEFGTDVSDKALRKAVKEHNQMCKIISEIGEMRKADNPPITGYEFHLINLVSYVCPTSLILPYLKETLAELKKRKPDAEPWYRARVAIVGSEIDDPSLTKLIEDCGAFVVSDRYCFGSLPGREPIELRSGQDAMDALAFHYMEKNECPRPMGTEATVHRRQYLYDLARKYRAEGIILENMKFCEYWGYERAIAGKWLSEGYQVEGRIPTCQIETDYANASVGQLRTRFQAFVESLEIKRLQNPEC